MFDSWDELECRYLIVRGEVKLTSHEWPKFNGKLWGDGAFLGELPILGESSQTDLHS